MFCNLVSLFTFLGGSPCKRGCRSVGFPLSLEPCMCDSPGFCVCQVQMGKILEQWWVMKWQLQGLPYSFVRQPSPWASFPFSTSLTKRWKSEFHSGIPIFPKHPWPWGAKSREEEEFSEHIMHSHLLDRNLMGANKVLLLRSQRRKIIPLFLPTHCCIFYFYLFLVTPYDIIHTIFV